MTKLNLTQPIIIVIVWGAIVSFIGALLTSTYSQFGWVAYSPSSPFFAPGSLAA